MRSDDRTLSTADLAEITVAAAAMLVNGFWEAALRLPEPDDFDDSDRAQLWTAILEARRRGQVSKTAVRRELRDLGWSETQPFRALEQALAAYVTLPDALEAIDLMLARKLQRQAMSVCRETIKELETAVDVEAVVRRHEIRIVDVASRADGADGWTKGDDVSEERLERLETGIADFDRVNGGLASGVLTVLAGRPGMGKSALGVTLLRNVAKRGLGAGCNSLEMPALDLIHRASAAEAYDSRLFEPDGGGVNPTYSDYEQRLLHGEMLERFEAAKARIKRLPIRWDDKQGRTISQIRMGGRRLRTIFGREAIDLRLLVVDHLGKIRGERKRENRTLELGDITDELMALAAELRIPVVALAQLSRAVEMRSDKRPMVQDLRESGRIEEDAHTVLFVYRQAYYDDLARERGEEIDEAQAARDRHTIEINTAKFRGGKVKSVRAFCDIGCNAILDESTARAHLLRASRQEDMLA